MTLRGRRIRVYTLGVAFVLATGVLWARLVEIQYVRRADYAEKARDQHVVPRKIPPIRGSIFDREGRPLALSVQMCSVAIKPHEVSDSQRLIKTLQRELGVSDRDLRRKLASRKPYVYVMRQCALDDERRATLSATEGVEVERVAGRIYPYDVLASKIVGFVGVDNDGRAGAEATFESDLRGEPGQETVVRNGSYRSDRYYRYVQHEPVDGRHIYLTIDAVIQEIAETEIQKAVHEHGARAGAAIVLDVKSGDVLALAEFPSIKTRTAHERTDSLWTIRSLSHVYEPGSTFKIVTAAALLESAAVTSVDSFDAENGAARLGNASISDPHPYGILTFADAFKYSSNIVMAKASLRLDPGEFYRYVRLFGFGSKTGVRMIGESGGTVLDVADWSLRTQSTMAFGQEIAVTPLQMACAMAAIANDGEMMLPRFTRGVVDAKGHAVIYDPVRVRRVVSKRTARTLREYCRLVVTKGTGQKADLDFIEVSGKTGTAQKASPGGGYLRGKFVSSFVGFAPHDEPRVTILVVLDEPRWASRYGGDSAAPVFARLCRGIANSTSLFDDGLTIETVDEKELSHATLAPNFLRMEREEALATARQLGANVLCEGASGRVVAQVPDPGSPVEGDDVVRLYVSNGKAHPATAPDMRGMSLREAKLLAARSGLRVRVVGSGTVKRQAPAPGVQARNGEVKIFCDGGPSVTGSLR